MNQNLTGLNRISISWPWAAHLRFGLVASNIVNERATCHARNSHELDFIRQKRRAGFNWALSGAWLFTALMLGAVPLLSQTTNGLMTGLVTDPSGAVIPGAHVNAINQGTGLLRPSVTDSQGRYLIMQLSPGTYEISVKSQGFATEIRQNVHLDVNQSVTLDFKLEVSSSSQNIVVTGAAPLLNTTSSTLSNVIDHEATVELPLNGREFTQLAILTPGAAPISTDGQQSSYTVALGAGGISPSVNGQQGYQNDFTMDGVLNNAVYTNVWAVTPPPDAIEEFNVQAHITDAQFAVSTGANVNVVTRSGTNTFHGALWEFIRNNDFDARTFPATSNLPYRQNQYGLYLGGPVLIPHVFNGRNNTWLSLYWEGFRYSLTRAVLADTLPTSMVGGDFSSVLGAALNKRDCNGLEEYSNEIYDPTTSVADSCVKGDYLRKPFEYNGRMNVIPPGDINAASALLLKTYYPAPNLPVADNVLPNYEFNGLTTKDSDAFGIRLDHRIGANDTLFVRLSRNKATQSSPESLPTYSSLLINYAQQGAVGYTHILNPKTILNFRYGYTYTNFFSSDAPAGAAFAAAIPGFSAARPAVNGISFGPTVTISNGYNGIAQTGYPLGPQEGMDYHLDMSKIAGKHTFGAGAMYYHLRFFDSGLVGTFGFTQNATAQDGTAGPTGFGPASFLLGTPDTYTSNVGDQGADQTVNWWGLYAQDQWQVTPKLVLVAGLRWDYVAPPNYHRIVSALNPLNGAFIVTGSAPPNYPQATGPSGFFNPQYNGYEPRLGLTYSATDRTVLHSAFAMLDDHNNTLIQENQDIRLSWPNARQVSLNSLDYGIPQMYLTNVPSASSYIVGLAPYASYGANPNNRIPYAMEFNLGIQQQLSNSTALKLDYVGSLGRHGYIAARANTALYPGPGAVLNREPYPQWGAPFAFAWNEQPSGYNALQTNLHKVLSSGLMFNVSYTWSKSMDWMSAPYDDAQNFYNIRADWGPSEYSFKHMFVAYCVYQLPVGKGKALLGSANSFVQTVAGGWTISPIVDVHSGQLFNANTGADTANSGARAGFQRTNRVSGVSPYASSQTPATWLNKAAFAAPAQYTYGDERRDDLTGPAYRDIDIALEKNFHLFESTSLQFRAESFNLFNQTNYGLPGEALNSAAFGKITSAFAGRELQFALKVMF